MLLLLLLLTHCLHSFACIQAATTATPHLGGTASKPPPPPPSSRFSRARDHGDRYHYLHHAKYECNYGVPFPIDFDSIFGTWRTFADYNLPDPNRTSAPTTCEPNGNCQSVRPRLRSPTGKREK